MNQTDNVSNENQNDLEHENTQTNETADQSEQTDSQEIDNLPIESIGSYGRVDEAPGEENLGSSDYSPSDV
jgi:hypothetical protein